MNKSKESRIVQGPFAAITAAQTVFREAFRCQSEDFIDAGDVCDALTRMGFIDLPTPEMNDAIFHLTEGDNVISRELFVELAQNRSAIDAEKEKEEKALKDVLSWMDDKGDGRVSVQKLRNKMSILRSGLSDKEITAMVRELGDYDAKTDSFDFATLIANMLQNKPEGFNDSFDVSQKDFLAITGDEPDDLDLETRRRSIGRADGAIDLAL